MESKFVSKSANMLGEKHEMMAWTGDGLYMFYWTIV